MSQEFIKSVPRKRKQKANKCGISDKTITNGLIESPCGAKKKEKIRKLKKQSTGNAEKKFIAGFGGATEKSSAKKYSTISQPTSQSNTKGHDNEIKQTMGYKRTSASTEGLDTPTKKQRKVDRKSKSVNNNSEATKNKKSKMASHQKENEGHSSKGHDLKKCETSTPSGGEKTQPSKTGDKKHKAQRKRFGKGKQKDGVVGTKKTVSSKVERIIMPKQPTDFDTNWKTLLQTLQKDEKRKPKKKEKSSTTHKTEQVEKTEKSVPDIWFADDEDDILIQTLKQQSEARSGELQSQPAAKNKLVKPDSFQGITKIVAMDCEMVGVGHAGRESILARVSIVNQFGQCLYDKYVKATENVTDYRTHVSGIRPEDIAKGEEFSHVQKEVSDIIQGKFLVGHAIRNDLKVLFLDHPQKKIRDTSRYKPFRRLFQGRTPSLKKLSEKLLGVKVQEGEHSSVQDAQATMRLYTMYRQKWEKEIRDRFKKPSGEFLKKKPKQITSTEESK